MSADTCIHSARKLCRLTVRCAQVNLPSGNVADPAAWPEVMTRLKESIVYAFDAAIMEREEEVKRGEAQRLTVGWNFCTWFLLKVSARRHPCHEAR